jgi:hypothetical protein
MEMQGYLSNQPLSTESLLKPSSLWIDIYICVGSCILMAIQSRYADARNKDGLRLWSLGYVGFVVLLY